MKSAFLLSSLFFSSLAAMAAPNSMNMICVTEVPTTSFVVEESGDKLVVDVIHHNGAEYAPIFDSAVTPSDLTTLATHAKLIKDLGTHQRFEFPKDKCKKDDTLIVSCIGDTPVQTINGRKVEAWGFYTSQQVDKSSYGKFSYTKVTLSMEVDDVDVKIPMRYYEGDCSENLALMRKKLSKN